MYTSSLRREMTALLITSIAKLLATMLLLRTHHIYAFKKSCKPYIKLHIASFTRASCAAVGTVAENEHKSGVLKNFVTNIIEKDLSDPPQRHGGRVVTRFPPEPNGYLHLGHAKSINFNFEVARSFKGVTHMRLDDTNPAKEDIEYVRSILQDVRWLVTGDLDEQRTPPWHGEVRHASDYFPVIYEAARYLIEKGLAYVDDLTPEQMKDYRGTLTEPGTNSPHRDRSVEENMRLFVAMKSGEFPDGHCILRAKIDMGSPNMNLRDPALYRIKKDAHPITGNQWCIYPMYDFAHAISDALEGITHSLCTLEFDNHRPLYDWFIDQLLPSGLLPYQSEGWRPRQYEFSRLNLQYTVLSKRKLIQLVNEGHVQGWDDPRMPTISAMRRRGFPAAAVRLFCDRIGISKAENNIDITVLEDCAREVLDEEAPRLFAIMNPLKVTITNWPDDDSAAELFSIEKHSRKAELGRRDLPFTRTLLIDRDDFFDTGVDGSILPPKGYKRLLPGGQVRLKYAYVIRCDSVVRAEDGSVCELKCSYDVSTRAGATPEGSKKVRGIVQWVSQDTAVPCDLRLYDRLFLTASPGRDQPDGDFLRDINPHSLNVVRGACVEASVLECNPGDTFQFERLGYFTLDSKLNESPLSRSSPLVFNRVVALKDTWSSQDNHPSSLPDTSSSSSSRSSVSDSTNRAAEVEDVLRVEFRVGLILSVEKHPDADSLYVEQVDCGDAAGPRTIVSGLVKHFSAAQLVGRKVVVVCNLKPSKMRGVTSEGMLLAAAASADSADTSSSGEERVELLSPPEDAPVGELIRVRGYGAPVPDGVLKSKTALDMWKRVCGDLTTNSNREASYRAADSVLLTSAGPCTVDSLGHAKIG